MSADPEEIQDESVDREKPLRGRRGFEPAHLSLALPAKQLRNVEISGERVLKELMNIVEGRWTDYLDADGNLKHPNQWTPSEAARVESFDIVTQNLTAGDGRQDRVAKFKLFSKIQAAKLIMENRGMLPRSMST